MQKIGILTDSTCDLTTDTLNKYKIKTLPLRVIYSYGDFEDKVNITPEEVYESFEKEIPSTSLPSPSTIESKIQEFVDEGCTHVIAITISSGLSGTYNAVRLALEQFPQLTSTAFDTKILSVPEGLIVVEAAKLVEEGKSYEEILELLPSIQSKMSAFYTLSTLEYLKKGGRIGKVAGTVGEMLNLKPIISVNNEGVYYTVCKARGRKQSLIKLADVLKGYLEKGKCKVCVLHGHAKEDAIQFMETIKNFDNIVDLAMEQIGPALVVHTGPGLIGLAIHQVD